MFSPENPLRNHMKVKMAEGQVAYSMTVRLVRSVDIASIAHTAGFDAIYIDLEHSTFPLDAMGQICMACNGLGVTPLVRVPDGNPFLIARVLDAGAMGIVVPGISNAREARAVVAAVKHPPHGQRSVAGNAAQLNYQPMNSSETTRQLDDASMVIAMIESGEGLANAAEIAAVEGIDILFVGAGDLSNSLGLAGQPEHPSVMMAFSSVLDACRAHGKALGVGGLGGHPELIKKLVASGAQYVSTGNDISFLVGAAIQKRRQFS